jgi:hypothetical protein
VRRSEAGHPTEKALAAHFRGGAGGLLCRVIGLAKIMVAKKARWLKRTQKGLWQKNRFEFEWPSKSGAGSWLLDLEHEARRTLSSWHFGWQSNGKAQMAGLNFLF